MSQRPPTPPPAPQSRSSASSSSCTGSSLGSRWRAATPLKARTTVDFSVFPRLHNRHLGLILEHPPPTPGATCTHSPPPTPAASQPQADTPLLSIPWICLFRTSPANGLRGDVVPGAWLLSRSLIFTRLTESQQVSALPSFLWLNNILLNGCATFGLSVCELVDTWAAATFRRQEHATVQGHGHVLIGTWVSGQVDVLARVLVPGFPC